MNAGQTVFSQLMEHVPIDDFRSCVRRYDGHYKVQNFSCWDQYLAMAFAQLTYREGLRDIEACLKSQQQKLYHIYWWLHGEPRPGLRRAISGLPRIIVTPEVSKHRVFVWLDSVYLPDHQTRAFARSDDLFFGILHSRIHEVWALAQGTQLREKESGFRYTPSTCFETFPFPSGVWITVRRHTPTPQFPPPPRN